jgi:hypothetical protein
VHLGFLEEHIANCAGKPRLPFLREERISKVTPFLFMHTGRGKVDEDWVSQRPWLQRIVSAGSVVEALHEKYALETKIRLMNVLFGPQQKGVRNARRDLG